MVCLILCSLFSFGVDPQSFPDPDVNLNEFKKTVQQYAYQTGKVWCPVRRILLPWIDSKWFMPPKDETKSTTCQIS